jgi:hypothetical protein
MNSKLYSFSSSLGEPLSWIEDCEKEENVCPCRKSNLGSPHGPAGNPVTVMTELLLLLRNKS